MAGSGAAERRAAAARRLAPGSRGSGAQSARARSSGSAAQRATPASSAAAAQGGAAPTFSRRPLFLSPSRVEAEQHLARQRSMHPALMPRRVAAALGPRAAPTAPTVVIPPVNGDLPGGADVVAAAEAGREGDAAAPRAAEAAATAEAQPPQLTSAGDGRSPANHGTHGTVAHTIRRAVRAPAPPRAARAGSARLPLADTSSQCAARAAHRSAPWPHTPRSPACTQLTLRPAYAAAPEPCAAGGAGGA